MNRALNHCSLYTCVLSHALYHSSESWLTTITPNCYSLQYNWCSKRGIYNATTAYHWFALYNGPPTWRCSNVNPLSSRKYVMVTHHDALPRRTSIRLAQSVDMVQTVDHGLYPSHSMLSMLCINFSPVQYANLSQLTFWAPHSMFIYHSTTCHY